MISKNWTRENLARLAGLFEGEGCICISRPKNTNLLRTSLSLKLTDEDVVLEFYRIVNIGTVSGPHFYKTSLGNKPVWRWQIADRPFSYAILCAIFPWLRARRRAKAREFISTFMSSSMYRHKQTTPNTKDLISRLSRNLDCTLE